MENLPTVVAVCGLPGSGKSYFAERLAEEMNAEYISSDIVRKEMYAERTYADEEKLSVYGEMNTRASRVAAEKKNVVLDATFYRNDVRDLLTDTYGPSLRWIEVRADESIIRHRLDRPRKHSEADFQVYLKIKDAWEPLEQGHLTLISENDNIEEMLKEAMQYLRHDP